MFRNKSEEYILFHLLVVTRIKICLKCIFPNWCVANVDTWRNKLLLRPKRIRRRQGHLKRNSPSLSRDILPSNFLKPTWGSIKQCLTSFWKSHAPARVRFLGLVTQIGFSINTSLFILDLFFHMKTETHWCLKIHETPKVKQRFWLITSKQRKYKNAVKFWKYWFDLEIITKCLDLQSDFIGNVYYASSASVMHLLVNTSDGTKNECYLVEKRID